MRMMVLRALRFVVRLLGPQPPCERCRGTGVIYGLPGRSIGICRECGGTGSEK
jgi:DnaJ-class molecular chaperone